jgi:type IV secretory pathway TraG/TraD family ATPase VirD4
LDWKPELAALCALDMAARGFEVILLDPFGTMKDKLPASMQHQLNFLDFVRTLQEARALAKEMIPRDGVNDGTTSHFLDMAEMKIAGMVALTCLLGKGPARSLVKVRNILSSPQDEKDAIGMMQKIPGLQGQGGRLSLLQGEEAGSAGTTTARFIQWLDSEEVAANIGQTSFDLKKLRQGGLAIFIIPGGIEFARLMTPWVRACVGTIARVVIREPPGEEHIIHCLFDEAPLLQHMEIVDDLLDKGAGWGFRCQWYWQNLQQISKCFPNQEQTFLSNTAQLYFSANDAQQGRGTADYISARSGNATVWLESENKSGGGSRQASESGKDASVSHTTNWGWSRDNRQEARPLWTVDEVLATSPRTCFTFLASTRPILTRLLRWYEPEFQELFFGARPTGLKHLLLSGAVLLAVGLGSLLAIRAILSLPIYQRTTYLVRPLPQGEHFDASQPGAAVREIGQQPNGNGGAGRRR